MALNLHRRPHLVHDYLPLAAAVTYPKCQRFPRQIRTLRKFLSPQTPRLLTLACAADGFPFQVGRSDNENTSALAG